MPVDGIVRVLDGHRTHCLHAPFFWPELPSSVSNDTFWTAQTAPFF